MNTNKDNIHRCQTITDEPSEKREIQWDGERFTLVVIKTQQKDPLYIDIWNPREATEIAEFIRGSLNWLPQRRVKMRFTEKGAIKHSIELWEWLAETGREKEDWPEWGKYGDVVNYCFLCEYDCQFGGGCDHCPYFKKFGNCCEEDAPFNNWYLATTKAKRKKYASEFLKQLKELGN